ncbi:hypothetical protein SLA2020_519630 [Shorea laevis]
MVIIEHSRSALSTSSRGGPPNHLRSRLTGEMEQNRRVSFFSEMVTEQTAFLCGLTNPWEEVIEETAIAKPGRLHKEDREHLPLPVCSFISS